MQRVSKRVLLIAGGYTLSRAFPADRGRSCPLSVGPADIGTAYVADIFPPARKGGKISGVSRGIVIAVASGPSAFALPFPEGTGCGDEVAATVPSLGRYADFASAPTRQRVGTPPPTKSGKH